MLKINEVVEKCAGGEQAQIQVVQLTRPMRASIARGNGLNGNLSFVADDLFMAGREK